MVFYFFYVPGCSCALINQAAGCGPAHAPFFGFNTHPSSSARYLVLVLAFVFSDRGWPASELRFVGRTRLVLLLSRATVSLAFAILCISSSSFLLRFGGSLRSHDLMLILMVMG